MGQEGSSKLAGNLGGSWPSAEIRCRFVLKEWSSNMANQDDGHIHQRCLLSTFFKNLRPLSTVVFFFLITHECRNSVIGIWQIITPKFYIVKKWRLREVK